MTDDYSDYVIKNGKLVGRFEEMYRECDDPWNRDQLGLRCIEDTLLRRACEQTSLLQGGCNAIDLGCGVGTTLAGLSTVANQLIGIDISETAIAKARSRLPAHTFCVGDANDFINGRGNCSNLPINDCNLLILCQTTWYILDDLEGLRKWLSDHWRGKYLVHVLSVYPPGVQAYGIEYFKDHQEILAWWGLNCLEHGLLTQTFESHTAEISYFFAQIS